MGQFPPIVGASWGHVGEVYAAFKRPRIRGRFHGFPLAFLGPSWDHFGAIFGPSGSCVHRYDRKSAAPDYRDSFWSQFWAILGFSWGHLGPSLVAPRLLQDGPKMALRVRGRPRTRGSMSSYLGTILAPSLSLLGPVFGAGFGPSSGLSWGHLGPSWGHLGAVLGGLWGLKTAISLGTF